MPLNPKTVFARNNIIPSSKQIQYLGCPPMIHRVSSGELPIKSKKENLKIKLQKRESNKIEETSRAQTIALLRAFSADGLLRMAALDLALPSTVT